MSPAPAFAPIPERVRQHERRRAARVRRSAVPRSVLQVLRTPGRPLDAASRAAMERRFGFDFAAVRIHDDAQAAASARDVRAVAYTGGAHVVLDREGARPYGPSVLAHELAHVVQQRAAPPPPSPVLRRTTAREEAAAVRAGALAAAGRRVGAM